jgi:hypothetical protein
MSDKPVLSPGEAAVAAFMERVVSMLETGRLPILHAKYADGQPVCVGFYLVPDSHGLCADCRKKVN